jgi:thiamine pyrophosphate-dependent acetolactate synthase large subunit-like protein
MKKTGAWLAIHALEQLPISHTFGIPGVHNTELYDQLNSSKKIKPVLVTHELGAIFKAFNIAISGEPGPVFVEIPVDIQLFKGKLVIVDVNIDYSKPTRFTQGVVKTVLKRFPPGDKIRFITRALLRKITG